MDIFKIVAELDCIAVKGKTAGVHIFTLGKSNWKHEDFLDAYYTGDWDKAIGHCETLIEEGGDLKWYYENMLERLREGKPDNWDGTYRATSK